ncbi:unnamed protein product [Clonostachys byssicola]|uniref:MOSC domain-containing protein n=1 Tax=Clonostachys byssicola TaxID=160290 RepID=A0A9N9UUQ4_9HYPO|nr:unnamed protein product [Clonostachys byssicola]
MKVVALWVSPIKGLRGIRLECADLGPQGIKHDRNFMLCRVEEGEEPLKLQLSRFPQCALFSQEIVGDSIQVRYNVPEEPLVPPCPEQAEVLEVPLGPDITQLRKEEVNLHQSKVNAYRMGERYDAWFTACFGFPTALFYIGDERRPILGTFSPDSVQSTPRPKGWLAALSDYMAPGTTTAGGEPNWLTFSDCAPFLITTGASLANVSARLAAGDMEMAKFRPNIVLDGEREWEEDFWTKLTLNGRPAFELTKMCVRCTSVNVDYDTGRPARGERGTVLKKLMADRRVDRGAKYSPVFGKYAFLDRDAPQDATITLGDDVQVTRRSEERPVFDWPIHEKEAARFYSDKV